MKEQELYRKFTVISHLSKLSLLDHLKVKYSKAVVVHTFNYSIQEIEACELAASLVCKS